ncbi:MAG: response regulator [Acidobacteria bacterium]|nr:response regulator [Acidobacteriota bacterium]
MNQNDSGKPAMQILIIDDDEMNREAMEQLLTIEGYKTCSAPDGTSGYSSAIQAHPDLILLDLNLPDIDGKQVIGMIRKQQELEKVPIVVVTGETQEEAQRAVKLGANAFFLKPVEFSALLESIPQVYANG